MRLILAFSLSLTYSVGHGAASLKSRLLAVQSSFRALVFATVVRQQASSPVFLRRNLVILNPASPRFTSQFSAASAPSGSDACRSNRQEQRKGGLKFAFRTRVRTMLIVVYCPPCDASAVQQKHMPYTPRTLLSCLPSCYVALPSCPHALPSCPHAFCLALLPPCLSGLGLRLKKMR